MELLCTRQQFLPRATIGELTWDGEHLCWILEDVVREVPGQPVESWKVRGETAIPQGRYRVVIDRSERFSKEASKKAGKPTNIFLMRLLDVPGFEGIRIHAGNSHLDTEGCLLTGRKFSESVVLESRLALREVQNQVQLSLDRGEQVWLTVSGIPEKQS